MFQEEYNEECYILTGIRIGRFWFARLKGYSIGKPCAVEFDHNYVLDNPNKVIGWIHTHPQFVARPSLTDDMTTKAWVTSLGKPMLCCILGTDGLRAHWFVDDESPSVEGPIRKCRNFLFGVFPDGKKDST